jgi:hypothetical protein
MKIWSTSPFWTAAPLGLLLTCRGSLIKSKRLDSIKHLITDQHLSMMANPLRSFAKYFNTIANPYDEPEALFEGFAPDAALQLANLYTLAESITYPLPLLVATTEHQPLVVLSPFSLAMLPGLPPLASKLGLVGDVSASGTLPTIITVENDWFHLSENVYVLPRDDMEQAWVAVAAGTLLLDAQVAGTNNAEQVRSRCMMPIPHKHVVALLRSQAVGTLSWQTLWTTVVQTILGDPAQMAAYRHFINFVRVASTQCPAVAGAVNA